MYVSKCLYATSDNCFVALRPVSKLPKVSMYVRNYNYIVILQCNITVHPKVAGTELCCLFIMSCQPDLNQKQHISLHSLYRQLLQTFWLFA